MTQDLSSENMEARRRQHNIFQMLKKKKENCQPRTLYPLKISFMNKEEMEIFSDEGKLSLFLEEVVSTERK